LASVPDHLQVGRAVPAWRRFFITGHCLSLDAPLVAILWQSLFAHAFGIPFSPAVTAALALAVWCIYVADRLLDTARFRVQGVTARHRFSLHNRAPLILALVTGVVLLALLSTAVPGPILEAGWLLGLFVGIYFVAVHCARVLPVRTGCAKELCVGFTFAAGSTLPVWSSTGVHSRLLIPAILFGSICAVNCLAIELWESRVGNRVRMSSTLLQWLSASLAAFAALCFFLSPPALHPIHAALCGASLLLFALLHDAGRFSAVWLRVLADVALCTPLLFWLT
jgi:hypothetical protein